MRNRNAGHQWERECATKLSPIFGQIITTRNGSIRLDAKKIDLMKEDGNRLPLNFQCKNSVNINYVEVLGEMPEGEDNIILHKKTSPKTSKTGRKTFRKQQELVVMDITTFMKLLNNAYKRGDCGITEAPDAGSSGNLL